MTNSKIQYRFFFAFQVVIFLLGSVVSKAQVGTVFISAYGYDSCIQIKNASTTVILEPNAGGRVIEYALNGSNVLYADSSFDGFISSPKNLRGKGHIPGGRFDIGPSRTKPNTDLFFFGKWKATITGKFSAKLVSQTDPVTKLYLIRNFVLDKITSKLTVTQTIVNTGSKITKTSFWSRTFATGNGICVMPVEVVNRFPKKYIMFMNRDSINMFPVDTNILVQDNLLIIKGPPAKPKLEMDVAAPGWIAYAAINNLLFIKKFKVYYDRPYGDVTAANTSIWYNGTQMTEIEPIGPWETIKPGEKKSFTEEWFIADFYFPANRNIDTNKLTEIIKTIKSPL